MQDLYLQIIQLFITRPNIGFHEKNNYDCHPVTLHCDSILGLLQKNSYVCIATILGFTGTKKNACNDAFQRDLSLIRLMVRKHERKKLCRLTTFCEQILQRLQYTLCSIHNTQYTLYWNPSLRSFAG